MGTENSSIDTRRRAKLLGDAIGSYHVDIDIDMAVSAVIAIFQKFTGLTPRFKVHGGTNAENLALQNIQVGISYGALNRSDSFTNFRPDYEWF